MKRNYSSNAVVISFALLLNGCAQPLIWPESPLYPEQTPTGQGSLSRSEAMAQISGHYAHFDIVSYEDTTPKQPMRTFIVSYGFTDFYQQDGQLFEQDRFCHAKQLINFNSVRSTFNDAATQAITPPAQAVELTLKNGQWQIFRPATPTLLGIDGDAQLTLQENLQRYAVTDDDLDGKPGVTVDIKIAGFINGELYILRREIFENYLTLQQDGRITGHVLDRSEQHVLGANLKILDKPSNPQQLPDPAMNPILLIPIDESIATCEALMAQADTLFPPLPSFQ